MFGFYTVVPYQLKKSELIYQLLFPQQYRSLPQRRLLLNIFRSIHTVCFSVLLGGLYFGQTDTVLKSWAVAVIISGVCLFLLDLYASAVVLFEIRGFTVLIKVILLAIALLLPADGQFNLLVLVIIFSSFISHSPRWLRHKSLLPAGILQRLAPQDEKIKRGSDR